MKLTPTVLSELTGLKRKDIIQYIEKHYPLFRIGKDEMDANMALMVTRRMRKEKKED